MTEFAPGSSRARGQGQEDRAAAHLEGHGLVVVERNVEIGGAEIDLVARDDEDQALVFVEVRSRRHDRHGRPEETVDRRKQGQIRRAATAYLVQKGLWEKVNVRFDVVGIVGGHENAPEITWIRGAFE